jgi:hypothetical protein
MSAPVGPESRLGLLLLDLSGRRDSRIDPSEIGSVEDWRGGP